LDHCYYCCYKQVYWLKFILALLWKVLVKGEEPQDTRDWRNLLDSIVSNNTKKNGERLEYQLQLYQTF